MSSVIGQKLPEHIVDRASFVAWLHDHNKAVLAELGFSECNCTQDHKGRAATGKIFGELGIGNTVVTVWPGSQYWVVKGKIPMAIAKILDKLNRLQIRAYGYASGIAPTVQRPDGSYVWAEHDESGQWFVPLYHIDTDEALQKFVQVLRQHRVID